MVTLWPGFGHLFLTPSKIAITTILVRRAGGIPQPYTSFRLDPGIQGAGSGFVLRKGTAPVSARSVRTKQSPNVERGNAEIASLSMTARDKSYVRSEKHWPRVNYPFPRGFSPAAFLLPTRRSTRAAGLFRRTCGGFDRQNWARSRTHDVFRCTSKNQVSETGPPVGPHND
jgi:hypothetical protein